MNSFNCCQFLHQGEFILLTQIIRIHFLYEFILCMNSLSYEFLYSSMTEPTIIPHSVQGEHYVCPVCDRLSVHGAFV